PNRRGLTETTAVFSRLRVLGERLMTNVRRALSIACAAVVCAAAPSRAQTEATSPAFRLKLPEVIAFDDAQVMGQPAGPRPTPRHTGIKAMFKDLVDDVKHLPSTENLFWAGVGGGLALAAHPFDDNVTPSLVNSNFADKFFKAGEVLGESPTLF